MGNRELVAWCAASAAILASVIAFSFLILFPIKETKTITQYRNHPKGIYQIPSLSDTLELGQITKVCDVWSNFDPNKATVYKLGQHYITECKIVRTSPKG